MITMHSNDMCEEKTKDFAFPSQVKRVEFTYDGGRLHVYVNGKEVLHSDLAGNDFSVLIVDDASLI